MVGDPAASFVLRPRFSKASQPCAESFVQCPFNYTHDFRFLRRRPTENQGENHTKKRNNERKTLHPILFALSDFFLPFLFFVVFFVIGCVYLTNIKHIFTPDDDAIIIVLIVFAGESKVQTSINKNNILAGVKNKDLLWRVGVSPCPIVGLSRVPRVPAPQSAVLGPSSVCHFANICQSRKTLLAVAKKQGG